MSEVGESSPHVCVSMCVFCLGNSKSSSLQFYSSIPSSLISFPFFIILFLSPFLFPSCTPSGSMTTTDNTQDTKINLKDVHKYVVTFAGENQVAALVKAKEKITFANP